MSNSYYIFSDCTGMVLLLSLNLWLLQDWKQSVSMSLAAVGSRCAALGMNLSGSGSWLPLSLFCFSQQMWCDCAVHHTNIIHFHAIFFVTMGNWLTVACFWCWRGKNCIQRSRFSCLCFFMFFDLSQFSLELERMRRIRLIIHGNRSPAQTKFSLPLSFA